jgi:hypothetical protein
MKKILLFALVGVLFMGAKGCNDCQKAQAEAVATCQTAGAESDLCKAAQAKAVIACAPKPEPTAEPTCPTCQPGYVCTDPAVGCVLKPTCPEACPTGQQCTDAAIGCVALPPPTTCDPACKADEKCVEKGATEKYYVCEKIPGPTEAPLIPDEELVALPGNTSPTQMWSETEAAINRWRTLHPEKWRGDGACLIDGAAGIDGAFLGIATELLRQSIVAGQSVTQDGQRSDALFVNRTGTDLYEEMHLFDYARGCVATGPNAFRGVYVRQTTEPPPPVTTTCPYEPCPEKYYEDGTTPHWKFVSHAHTMGNADSTPITVGQEPFCHAIGMSPMADGTLRAGCPMRPDGHSERVAVEDWLLDGGPVRDSKDGGDCTPNNTDNPYAFLMRSGNCRNCNVPKTVCTDWY